jgi:hypothetical protein
VVLRVQLLHPLLCHMGIYLGRGQITVPQQHLHHPQVGTVIQQMGGKRVAQGMG